VLSAGSRLVVLAEDDDSYSVAPTAFDISKIPAPEAELLQPHPEELLFCGWRRDMQDTIVALDQLVDHGSTLHILCDRGEQQQADTLWPFLDLAPFGYCLPEDTHNDDDSQRRSLNNLHLKLIEGSHTCRKDLEKLPLEMFDSVLVLATGFEEGERNDMEATDSESLACLLRIRDIVKRRTSTNPAKHPKMQEMISEILDSRTKDLVERNRISGYVMSNSLVSAALAMISESREVNDILLVSGAARLCLEPKPSSTFKHTFTSWCRRLS
jgi:hypothetical protein